jgi:hypothetical protein
VRRPQRNALQLQRSQQQQGLEQVVLLDSDSSSDAQQQEQQQRRRRPSKKRRLRQQLVVSSDDEAQVPTVVGANAPTGVDADLFDSDGGRDGVGVRMPKGVSRQRLQQQKRRRQQQQQLQGSCDADDDPRKSGSGAAASESEKGHNDSHSDECAECGQAGELLMCDGCPRAFHLACVGLRKQQVPEGEWFCAYCQSLGLTGQ